MTIRLLALLAFLCGSLSAEDNDLQVLIDELDSDDVATRDAAEVKVRKGCWNNASWRAESLASIDRRTLSPEARARLTRAASRVAWIHVSHYHMHKLHITESGNTIRIRYYGSKSEQSDPRLLEVELPDGLPIDRGLPRPSEAEPADESRSAFTRALQAAMKAPRSSRSGAIMPEHLRGCDAVNWCSGWLVLSRQKDDFAYFATEDLKDIELLDAPQLCARSRMSFDGVRLVESIVEPPTPHDKSLLAQRPLRGFPVAATLEAPGGNWRLLEVSDLTFDTVNNGNQKLLLSHSRHFSGTVIDLATNETTQFRSPRGLKGPRWFAWTDRALVFGNGEVAKVCDHRGADRLELQLGDHLVYSERIGDVTVSCDVEVTFYDAGPKYLVGVIDKLSNINSQEDFPDGLLVIDVSGIQFR